MAPPCFTPNKISSVFEKDKDAAASRFCLSENREISVDGVTLLFDVPENVTLSSFSSVPHSCNSDFPPPPEMVKQVNSKSENCAFLGLSVDDLCDRILNPIGKFNNRKFLSIFRFKTWWSTAWIGLSGSDLQKETQIVMFHVPELNSYVVIIPIIEQSFRSAIHPGSHCQVLLSIESGSTKVRANSFTSSAYLQIGDNPYILLSDAFAAIRVHLGTFRLREEKSPPRIFDKFGWCTWDAFYLTVEPVGVWHGVQSFAEGGIPPRFLIIDDGWQSINFDHESPFEDSSDLTGLGSQMLCRLYRFGENEKFAKYQAGTMLGPDAPEFDQQKHDMMFKEMVKLAERKAVLRKEGLEEEASRLPPATIIEYLKEKEGAERGGLKALVSDLKKKFPSLDDFYVWHALCGAWGGVRPGISQLKSTVIQAKMQAGLEDTMTDLAVVMVEQGGIGLVDPSQADDLYESMHSHLADAGITGVKVDVIHTLEYVSEDYGGRVELAKKYYDGLTKSLRKNFSRTGLIASMEQCNDFFFLGTNEISMARVGDDFWFEDPNGDPMGVYWLQGVHMVNCGYNSLWQGQFIYPDWDMFQSHHVCAEFHAGSRAICGGPIYVSDKVGSHNFELLRKLVLPDGTILRCQHFALPTRDCLFVNPLSDGKTPLKLWNLNKCGGVIGIFNCQGAGWCPEEHRSKAFPECYKEVSGSFSPSDIEWECKDFTAKFRDHELFCVYYHKAGKLYPKKGNDTMDITLQPSSFEIATVSPIYKLSENAEFAVVGLENMFNAGGAIESLEYTLEGKSATAVIEIKGAGKLLVYSSLKPVKVLLDDDNTGFEWSNEGVLKFEVPWKGGEISKACIITSL